MNRSILPLSLLAAGLVLAAPAPQAQSAKTQSSDVQAPAASRVVPPANDNFANATVIGAAGQSLSTTVEATSEAGEPAIPASCATGDSGQSVWFRFTSADGTPITLDTDGSVVASPPGPAGQFTDTIMSVYTGATLATLTRIGCNDDDPGNTLPGDFTSRIANLTVTAGTTYYVRVSSYLGGNRQDGEVRLTLTGNVTPTATASTPNGDVSLTVGPNPFAGSATVRLAVAQTQAVAVAVYDVTGRRVAVLHDDPVAAGQVLALRLDGETLPSGVYVVRATGADLALTERVTVVR